LNISTRLGGVLAEASKQGEIRRSPAQMELFMARRG
jgi:hypothetical protein